MTNEASVGVAWGSPGAPVAEISIAVEAMTGNRLKSMRLVDLAGPNETIQVLLNPSDWILVAKAAAVIYGAEIMKEAAKATWKAAAPKFAMASVEVRQLFAGLVQGVQAALSHKAPVIFGLPRTMVNNNRNIGIEIADGSPEYIAWIVAILAANGAEIEKRLDAWIAQSRGQEVSYDQNSDCSVRISVSDEGFIQLKGGIYDPSTSTRSEVVVFEFPSAPPLV